MTTELTTASRVQTNLGAMTKQFQSTLPAHIDTKKFLRAAVTAVQNTPDLQEAEVPTIISACQKAATDGLILDGKEAALVVFNKNVAPRGAKAKWEKHAQYMPMVAGLLKKARNSGQISMISAHCVYMNDAFTYKLGLEPQLDHTPIIDGAPGDLRCVYAIAKLKDGTVQFEVMTKTQVYKILASSKSGWDSQKNEPKGIWKTWEDQMWRKTALKALLKYLPSSSDLDDLITYDNDEFGLADTQAAAPAAAPVEQKAPPKKKATRAAAAILKDKPAAKEPAEEAVVIEGELVDDAPPNDGSDQQTVDDLI